MITGLIITATFFFSLSIFFLYGYYLLYKEHKNIIEENNKFAEIFNTASKVQIGSTGFYIYEFFDHQFNINSYLYIPFRVTQKDVTGANILFKYDFKTFERMNAEKNSKIEFDDDSYRYLRMIEVQWHGINNPNFVWAEFEPQWSIGEQKNEAEEKTVSLELNSFEKNDINSFLKYSNIPDEKKDAIKKMLNI